jgi:predicted RNA methylase
MNGYLPGMEHEQRDVSLGQYFTPPELAKRMAELVDLRGKRVLEPSAGSGNLVRAALDAGADEVCAIDVDPRNYAGLWRRFGDNFRVEIPLERDFLALEPFDFDVALMNPPWDDGQHWKHIAHALKFAPVVVALAPLAMLEGEDRRTEFWSKCHLSDLCVCSSRPKFGEDGGKMPVACYVLKRNGPLPRGDAAHYTAVRFW